MNRIRLLPDHVANQIAAGEVVERPASIVKELVENSLDARATQISVEIQAGGRSLVRVSDDGIGMSRDDALLSLERHATSKIARAEDLTAIATMGFRGEALPSIASVSRFTLTTREREVDSPEGTRIVVNGGKMLEVKAAGRATGTTIEVRQLFFNLPARRKFLRSQETEASHIQHYLTLAALAFPEVAFTFQKDGRLVWQLPAVQSSPEPESRLSALRERFRALSGGAEKLLSLDQRGEITAIEAPDFETAAEGATGEVEKIPLRLWGLLGAPGVSRSTREEQHLFVNRRPIENRALNFALMEGYHTALMKGRYPVCCLFLEIDPAAVDVNIHPAKREVKFRREQDVRRFVAQAVRDVLMKFHGDKRASGSPQLKVEPGPSVRQEASGSPTKPQISHAPQGALPNFPPALVAPAHESRTEPLKQPVLGIGFRQSPAEVSSGHGPSPAAVTAPAAAQLSPSPQPAGAEPVPLLHVPLRILGVIGNLYVVLESDRGLVLLDQHAAHERVLFEQMLNRLEQNQNAPSQRLLLPETVELSARDANFLRQQLGVLTRLGVGLSEFGERTFLLDALPPFVKASEPRRFVIDLVDQLKAAGAEVNSLRLGEHTVAKTVCRHAVKANDPLRGPELENLVADLRRCAMPYTCPHGRPTLIEMNFRELEKKFGRAQ